MFASALGKIHQQVMWNRLIAVVEEQAQAILRTAFGSVVREAGDLSAGVYDLEGHMLAQAVTGPPVTSTPWPAPSIISLKGFLSKL